MATPGSHSAVCCGMVSQKGVKCHKTKRTVDTSTVDTRTADTGTLNPTAELTQQAGMRSSIENVQKEDNVHFSDLPET